ncbi:hypothetical protein [Paenibacillus tianjinensis]|uniref:HNH endonuclease n=1 Tax=Paenibacillus tianjinensis TaxID=2810347 RepID=A0ABX7LDJ1_9BACL|nr:hypothetical protein [Paenibacillus tianjinensis]QSF46193.1 hypothetical protein JRJ22_06165 [Paenibacillus tianjinensis]
MKKIKQQCYWCGKQATSREHVPPRCLFPTDKDVGALFKQSFRSELITVPSCDEHNSLKSGEDEYLMACLTAKVGNNFLAYAHTQTKLKRSLQLHKNLLDVEEKLNIMINEREFPVSIINVDVPRLSYSFEAIARALFFHEFRIQLKGRCVVASDMFLSPDASASESNQYFLNGITMIQKEQSNWNTPIKGKNPLVFTYQFSPVDEFGSQTLALKFYEQTDIYVCIGDMIKLKPYKKEFDVASKMLGLRK